MKDKKKKVYLFLGMLFLLLTIVGISFAYMKFIIYQETTNVMKMGCFEVTFTDKNPISLESAHPIYDSEGLELTPYTFTIENVCNSSASYQINLETLAQSDVKVLSDKYLKANLKEEDVDKITTKLDKSLNPNLDTETTISNATEAYKLLIGVLAPNQTKTFNLRVWMHSDTEGTDSMNATYKGKISVTSSYYEDKRGTLMPFNSSEAFWQYKDSITKVVFEDTMNSHETSEELIFDVSAEQNGSIMAYLVVNDDTSEGNREETPEEGTLEGDIEETENPGGDTVTPVPIENIYTLYIQEIGGIKANTNSSSLFSGFSNLQSIENLNLLDTSSVEDMSFMFANCSNLTDLDVSSFDTSKVTNMNNMFYECKSLTQIVYGENFIKQENADISNMYSGCPANKPTHSSWNGVF